MMSLLPTASYNYNTDNINSNLYKDPSSSLIRFTNRNHILTPNPKWSLPQRLDHLNNLDMNFIETSSTTNKNISEPEDDGKSTLLGGIVAFLGLFGVIVPFLTVVTIPLQLLNPNLILAKSVAFLSIPVAMLTYGRSLQDKTVWMDLAKFIDENTDHFQQSISKQLGSSHSNRYQTRDIKSANEQCIQRIACEGLFKSLPQILLKSVLKGQEGMLRSLENFKHFENITIHQKSRLVVTPRLKIFEIPITTGRRKHLANYALSKIKEEEKLSISIFNANQHKISSDRYGCLIFKCSLMM